MLVNCTTIHQILRAANCGAGSQPAAASQAAPSAATFAAFHAGQILGRVAELGPPSLGPALRTRNQRYPDTSSRRGTSAAVQVPGQRPAPRISQAAQ